MSDRKQREEAIRRLVEGRLPEMVVACRRAEQQWRSVTR